jgi:hypothetical protein
MRERTKTHAEPDERTGDGDGDGAVAGKISSLTRPAIDRDVDPVGTQIVQYRSTVTTQLWFSSRFSLNFTIKKRFPVTSKYRQIYGVLNVDEIKN